MTLAAEVPARPTAYSAADPGPHPPDDASTASRKWLTRSSSLHLLKSYSCIAG